MALRICLKCSTAYAIGPTACPQCGAKTRNAIYDWESDVASANAYGSTYYLAEGQDVPPELPDEVRLVGPGAPKPKAGKPKAEPKPDVVKDEVTAKGGIKVPAAGAKTK